MGPLTDSGRQVTAAYTDARLDRKPRQFELPTFFELTFEPQGVRDDQYLTALPVQPPTVGVPPSPDRLGGSWVSLPAT